MPRQTMFKSVALRKLVWSSSLLLSSASFAQDVPPGRWVEVSRDPQGGRRGSAIRYAAKGGRFILWGFMTPDMELLQENPLMQVPEYDVVAFDPAAQRWASHLPPR